MAIPYYRWFPGDYSRDTRHLSLMQHGAYRLLIDLYMDTGPLRNELQYLHRWLHAESVEEKGAVEFILGEFFLLEEGRWRHKRCDEELTHRERTYGNHVAGAAKARQAKALKAALTSALKSTLTSELITRHNQNQNQKKLKNTSPSVPGFLQFWATWPNNPRKGGKAKCQSVWVAKHCEESSSAIIAHVELMKESSDWRGGYCPAPLVYLNQARWDGASLSPPPRKFVI